MKARWLIMLTGIVLLGACKGRNANTGADSTYVTNQKALSSKNDTVQPAEKLVKTADMRFKVKSVQQTGQQIASLTKSCNGVVFRHTIGSNIKLSRNIHLGNDSIMQVSSVNATSLMTVRIPPERLEEFVDRVSAMGINIDSLNINIQNRTFDYLSTTLKGKIKEKFITKQEITKSAEPEKIIQEKDDMVDRHINNSRVDDSVKNSTITLYFYETNVIKKEIVADDDLSAYNPPFLTRLALALKGGWDLFVDLLVGLVNIWVLAVTGIAAWFVYARSKSKKSLAITKFKVRN